jgi:hypothetical protein
MREIAAKQLTALEQKKYPDHPNILLLNDCAKILDALIIKMRPIILQLRGKR